MEEFLNITDVLGRSEDGVTRPFICRCEDDNIYFVKGRDAGYLSLRNEWIAGQIAEDFELPIPSFKILNAPGELIEYSAIDDISDLGSGCVFGSQKASDNLTAFNRTIDFNDDSLKKRLLLFDWWINNDDRQLNERGGNVNLLWNLNNSKLVVIDHNLAFTDRFNPEAFWDNHVFGCFPNEIFTKEFILEYEVLLENIMLTLSDRLSEIPDEWFPLDDYKAYKNMVINILNKFKVAPNDFWRGLL